MVLKKKAVTLKKVNVDSSIDMRINKSDVIELMMEEEEARLKDVWQKARENTEKGVKTFQERAFEIFKQDNAEFVNAMEVKYKSQFQIHNERATDLSLFIKSSPGCGSDLYIRMLLSFDTITEIQKLEKTEREAREAYGNFRHDSKKTKCMFIRKMLEMSEDGQDLLEKLKDVKLTLPASK